MMIWVGQVAMDRIVLLLEQRKVVVETWIEEKLVQVGFIAFLPSS